jgi:hypothetical protein
MHACVELFGKTPDRDTLERWVSRTAGSLVPGCKDRQPGEDQEDPGARRLNIGSPRSSVSIESSALGPASHDAPQEPPEQHVDRRLRVSHYPGALAWNFRKEGIGTSDESATITKDQFQDMAVGSWDGRVAAHRDRHRGCCYIGDDRDEGGYIPRAVFTKYPSARRGCGAGSESRACAESGDKRSRHVVGQSDPDW